MGLDLVIQEVVALGVATMSVIKSFLSCFAPWSLGWSVSALALSERSLQVSDQTRPYTIIVSTIIIFLMMICLASTRLHYFARQS